MRYCAEHPAAEYGFGVFASGLVVVMLFWSTLRGWRSIPSVVALVLACTVPAAAGTDEALDDFVAMYHCAVVEMIARVHAHPHPEQMHRFIILDRLDAGSSYVQCLFFHSDHAMLCEAASGFYASRGDEPRLWPSERKALADLGFSKDGSHGNFQRYFTIRSTSQFDTIADVMLRALYEGYGARKDEIIEVHSPYAMPHGLLPRQHCVPVS
jgi:hypothetical protein